MLMGVISKFNGGRGPMKIIPDLVISKSIAHGSVISIYI